MIFDTICLILRLNPTLCRAKYITAVKFKVKILIKFTIKIKVTWQLHRGNLYKPRPIPKTQTYNMVNMT